MGVREGAIEMWVPAKQLVIRRYLDDGKMLVEMVCKGLSTTRVFTRVPN